MVVGVGVDVDIDVVVVAREPVQVNCRAEVQNLGSTGVGVQSLKRPVSYV